MTNFTSLSAIRQEPFKEKFFLALLNLASEWNAKLILHSRSPYAPLLALHQDFEKLRQIPILDVARALGLDILKTGIGTHAMREEREITSLVLFEKDNRWKRFSGKERGGVSAGSTLDLVMHARECSLREAAEFLSSRFL